MESAAGVRADSDRRGSPARITSYNVCYTKLLRIQQQGPGLCLFEVHPALIRRELTHLPRPSRELEDKTLRLRGMQQGGDTGLKQGFTCPAGGVDAGDQQGFHDRKLSADDKQAPAGIQVVVKLLLQ